MLAKNNLILVTSIFTLTSSIPVYTNTYLREENKKIDTQLTSENTIQFPIFKNIEQSINLNKVINIAIIEKLRTLKPDWNGYGAKTFDDGLINKFLKIINSLDVQPIISPTGRQSLVLSYDLDKNKSLSFEIFKSRVTMAYLNMDDLSESYEKEISQKDIKNKVISFYGMQGWKHIFI